MARCCALSLILCCVAVATEASVLRYEGEAVDPDSGAVLYHETHYLETTARQPRQRLVLYRCAGSEAVFARKRVRYGAQAERPQFELEDARAGYREGLRQPDGADAVAYVQRGSERERTGALPAQRDFVADAGFDEFVKRHWDRLQAGEAVALEFLVPADLGTMALKIRRHRDERIDGRDASVIRLSLGAWWGFIAPHIDAAYDRQTRTLLRYQGISNLRGEDGRNLEVRIDFPARSRQPSDAASFATAAGLSLAGACLGA